MTMALSLQKLRSLPDEELVAQHDQIAEHTAFGRQDFLNELHRREADRAVTASYKLAQRAYWLAVVNGALALAAVVVALVAIFVQH